MIDTYQAVNRYFRKADKAIRCSINDTQRLDGIRSCATWLQNVLSYEKSVKIICSFVLDGERIYLRDQYSFYGSKVNNTNFPYAGPLKIDDLINRLKDLVPCDVYVIIGDIECAYNVADFILLGEDVTCQMPAKKS